MKVFAFEWWPLIKEANYRARTTGYRQRIYRDPKTEYWVLEPQQEVVPDVDRVIERLLQ